MSYYRTLIQSGVLLLDIYPSTLPCYALNKLKDSSTLANRVRNSVTNVETDIGFIDNDYDDVSLSTAIGANSGLVTTLYDQSVSNDVRQATALRQPSIMTAGTLVTSGGKAALQGATSQGLGSVSNFSINSESEIWMFFVVDVSNIATNQILAETSISFGSFNGALLIQILSNATLRVVQRTALGVLCDLRCPITTGRKLISVRIRTGEATATFAEIWINGVSQTTTVSQSSTSIAFRNDNLFLMARNSSGNAFTGKFQGFIPYAGNQTANRLGIETEINDYYGIY